MRPCIIRKLSNHVHYWIIISLHPEQKKKAQCVYVILSFWKEIEKTPHNPPTQDRCNLPTSSSRAIISHYNIALGQLEVEDYPVCWMGSGISDYRARIIATTTTTTTGEKKLRSASRYLNRIHQWCDFLAASTQHRQPPPPPPLLLLLLYLPTRTIFFFSHAHHQHHQIFSSLFLHSIRLAPVNISNAAWWSPGSYRESYL